MKLKFETLNIWFLAIILTSIPIFENRAESIEEIFGDAVQTSPIDEEFASEKLDESSSDDKESGSQDSKVKIFVSSDQQVKKEKSSKFAGERSSLIDWEDLKEETYLSFEKWKVSLKVKEDNPSWQRSLRERKLKEKVGFVIECTGDCIKYRGLGFSKVDYLSRLQEGDELMTKENGHLWAFLLDGTIIRMSPKSSLTLKEFNIGEKENFVFLRVNSGNILIWSRAGKEFIPKDYRETDPIFYPLTWLEANTYNEKLKVSEDNLFNYLESGRNHLPKYERLNKLIIKNAKRKKESLYFIVMPNGTILGKDITVETIVLTGNSSYFKIRDETQLGLKEPSERSPPTFFYRGFKNTKESSLESSVWYEINQRGRELSLYDKPRRFAIGEFLTKNIPTILIARELFYKEYSGFTQEDQTAESLAGKYGYRLWGSSEDDGSDLNLRLKFLREFTRRLETANLLTADQFKKRLEKKGEKWTFSRYDGAFFKDAMAKFYNYREGVSILNTAKEILNSERKPYWKYIHGLK